MTRLQSFPPDIRSLMCRDPILERLDLNLVCFISHDFRNEAKRELFNRFPILRVASNVNAQCLALACKPHLVINITSPVLLLPSPTNYREIDTINLSRRLDMCVNLKELALLFEGQGPKGSYYTMFSQIFHLVFHKKNQEMSYTNSRNERQICWE